MKYEIWGSIVYSFAKFDNPVLEVSSLETTVSSGSRL